MENAYPIQAYMIPGNWRLLDQGTGGNDTREL